VKLLHPGLNARRAVRALARRALLRYVQVSATHTHTECDRVVILLSSAWGMGGTIRATLNLAGWLAQRREVEILTPYRRRDEPFFGEFPRGVAVTALADRRPGRAPSGVAGLAYLLLDRLPSVLFPKADRLHRDHSLWTDLRLARLLRRRGGILIGTRPGLNVMAAQMRPPGFLSIGVEQMNLDHHRPNLKQSIERWYPGLDAVVALTDQDSESYGSLLPRRVKVATIPNTVRPLGGPGVDSSARVVVAAGRLGRLGQKGFDLLLLAWAGVAKRHPDWRLRIHGEGPLRPELESMMRDLQLTSTVELAGATDDMGGAMAEASIFALSSRYEGFPLILLEAMSKGLACVSFDCPTGPADIIRDHEHGILVPAEHVDPLAGALLEVVADRELRARLGNAARLTSAAYTMDSIGPRWDALVDDLLHVPSTPSPAPSGSSGGTVLA